MVASAEFGMDGVTHSLLFGTTRNPWNLALIAVRIEWWIGSSGGGGHGAARDR